ncbi:unnamed protein product [Symbiodinium natans]|uniref:Uncharacterized protein n=1 Tax=Symbiodinium natans TaxID=878477 RepID=A0A812UZC1_9DINO|nr:unnamed protein product [Symbiodinium natans]
MTSHGDYHLIWYDVRSERDLFQPDQFIFETVHAECAPSLSRVRRANDLFELLSGGDREATTKVVVAVLALLGGNLIARGQWAAFFSFVGIFLTVGVFQQLQALAIVAAIALVCHFVKTLWDGTVSFEWLITVMVIVVLAVFFVMVVRVLSKQDPRSYVLLKESSEHTEHTEHSALIRNQCCMDVKVLSFEANDNVRFVPRGGLLPKGSVVKRGCDIDLGTQPPYSVKIFAPFETELGTWTDVQGHYVLRATAPPAIITPSSAKSPTKSPSRGKPSKPSEPSELFRNSTETEVVLCVCQRQHWTSSLWLPLSQGIARLRWPGRLVKPNEEVEVPAPCVVRVYTGLVNVFGVHGPIGGVLEQACCMIEAGEDVDFVGGITWSRPLDRARNSVSSLLSLSLRGKQWK